MSISEEGRGQNYMSISKEGRARTIYQSRKKGEGNGRRSRMVPLVCWVCCHSLRHGSKNHKGRGGGQLSSHAAYIVMACMVMAYIVMARSASFQCGLYSYGLYSHGPLGLVAMRRLCTPRLVHIAIETKKTDEQGYHASMLPCTRPCCHTLCHMLVCSRPPATAY